MPVGFLVVAATAAVVVVTGVVVLDGVFKGHVEECNETTASEDARDGDE